MKNLIMAIAIANFLTHSLCAQLSLPEPSPNATLIQKVGFTTINFNYSRPSAKGRKIFGQLVPYGELWRTGASDATCMRISDNIMVQGKLLKKGSYSLYTIPSNNEWTIIINRDTTLHGTSGYDDSLDVFRFVVPTKTSETNYETFTISILNIKNGLADVVINWESTEVSFQIDSEADKKVMNQIQKRIVIDKENNPGLFYQAALYYFENGKDLKIAQDFLSKAIAAENDVKYFFLKSKILNKEGKKNESISTANKALAMAKEKNLKHYISMIQTYILELQGSK